MPDLDALRRLVCDMHQHLPRSTEVRRHALLTASQERVRRAPVRRNAPREQHAARDMLSRLIVEDLSREGLPSEMVRQQLSKWKGAKVR